MFFFGFGVNLLAGWLGLLALLLAIWAAFWTFFDARRRGLPGLFWAGVSFSLFPLGFLGYLAYRAAVRRPLR